jgi:N-hydroxyarylamine O-acetyltransferase
VHLDRPYLADVGFGDGLIEPTPIVAGVFRQDALEFRLERIDARWWRFHNHPHGGAPSFDFELAEASQERLAERCEWLQSAPESPFVLNAVCQRYAAGRLMTLRGRTLKLVCDGTVEKRTIDSQQELGAVLREMFGIELADEARLWQTVLARHEAWQRERAST